MIYGDEQRLVIGGAGGRVICAANRPPDAPYPVTTGTDRYGDYLRFETMPGDVSANEALAYRSHPRDTPKRAMIALESRGNDRSRRGKRIAHHFGLVIEPGRKLVETWFTVLDQLNAAPLDGRSWRPPPMEFGMVVINHYADPNNRRSILKDKETGRPLLFEHFQLKANVWDAQKNKQVQVGRIRSKEPIERGAPYAIGLAFVDGGGEAGRLEFWLAKGRVSDTDLTCEGVYAGPTGYANFGAPYPAFGAYQPPAQPSLAARYYGWRESIRAAG